MFAHSTKHAQHNEVYSRRDAQVMLEMARAVAGGDRELRARPIVSTYQCCISPLVYDAGPIEAAVELARGGLPSGFVAMGIGCATAPATLAGTLVQMNAEMVGGMTIVEALVPGAVTFCGPYPTFMDLRTGDYRQDWGPEDTLLKLAFAQLAHRYRVPINIMALDTGAKTQDWQAGLQHAVSLLAVAAAGRAEMITGTGTLHGAAVYDNVNVVLDAELFRIICEICEAPSEPWLPPSFAREPLEAWEALGRPGARERARERVREILATHEPEPLPEDLDRELRRMIAAREAEG
jgi:trimethylamine--corrinoid protein Co-methyltransferase